MAEIFPDVPSVIRLVESVVMEIADEWQVTRRYFSQESMRKLTSPGGNECWRTCSCGVCPRKLSRTFYGRFANWRSIAESLDDITEE